MTTGILEDELLLPNLCEVIAFTSSSRNSKPNNEHGIVLAGSFIVSHLV
jgi:hypothetical protein